MEIKPIREQNCIRCGRCIEVCPMHLMPNMLVRYAKAGLYDECQDYYIDYCSGCGACVYVCPAKIPLLRYINIAKRELTKEAAKSNVQGVAIRLKKEVKSEAKIKKLYPMAFAIIVAAVMLTLLALTESSTRAALEAREDQKTLEMLQGIFPKANFYVFDEVTEIYTLYNNSRNGIGYAFYAEGWGYGGKMVILVGLEDKETIKGIMVLSQNESWAYWDRVVDSNFFDQFIGLRIENCYLKRYGGVGGQVDSVTGATVSSRAVVDAVRETALEKVKSIR